MITVLIGPSGAGKSTLLAATADRCPVTIVRTVTTRPRRPGEDDLTHEFVDPATFADRQDRGQFLGTHRQYGHEYGLPVLAPGGSSRGAAVKGTVVKGAGMTGAVVTCLRAAVVERLRQHHSDLDVVALDAPIPVLLERLTIRGDRGRADPVALRAEASASRELADLVLDATRPVAELADQLAARITFDTGRPVHTDHPVHTGRPGPTDRPGSGR